MLTEYSNRSGPVAERNGRSDHLPPTPETARQPDDHMIFLHKRAITVLAVGGVCSRNRRIKEYLHPSRSCDPGTTIQTRHRGSSYPCWESRWLEPSVRSGRGGGWGNARYDARQRNWLFWIRRSVVRCEGRRSALTATLLSPWNGALCIVCHVQYFHRLLPFSERLVCL